MGQKIILGLNFSIFFCLANLLGTITWVFLPNPGVQGPKMRVLCHFFRPGPSNEEESGLVQIPSWDIGQTVLSTWANLDLTSGILARPWGQDREKGHWDKVGPRLGTRLGQDLGQGWDKTWDRTWGQAGTMANIHLGGQNLV